MKQRSERVQIEETTTFLNVDLDLAADFDLKPLVSALQPLDCLHVSDAPPYEAHLEFSCCVDTPSSTIESLLEVLEALPPAKRELLDSCTSRRFDIGVQSGLAPHSWVHSLAPDLLRRMALLGVELGLTVYGTRTRYVESPD